MGQSAPSERRQHLRARVKFRSDFTSPFPMVGGEGFVTDISLGGCRVESEMAVEMGTNLELRIMVPTGGPPLAVEQATVRWTRDREFGVAFRTVRSDEWVRLNNFVMDLISKKPP